MADAAASKAAEATHVGSSPTFPKCQISTDVEADMAGDTTLRPDCQSCRTLQRTHWPAVTNSQSSRAPLLWFNEMISRMQTRSTNSADRYASIRLRPQGPHGILPDRIATIVITRPTTKSISSRGLYLREKSKITIPCAPRKRATRPI
jgi:hypothetical protein